MPILLILLSLAQLASAVKPPCDDQLARPRRVLSPKVSWTPELIIEVIRSMAEAKLPRMNNGYVRADPNGLVAAELARKFGHPVKGKTLIVAADKHFGSWDHALEAAGLTAGAIRAQVAWTPELTARGIRALHGRVPLHIAAIQKDTSSFTSQILERDLMIATTGAALFDRVNRTTPGGWYAALEALGIDAESLRRAKPELAWTEALVLSCVRALNQNEQLRSARAVRAMTDDHFNHIVGPVLGQPSTPDALLAAVQRYFKSWDQALRTAGLDSRLARARNTWTPEVIHRDVRALLDAALPMHPTYLQQDPRGLVMATLSLSHRRLVTGMAFYHAATHHYGSWARAAEGLGVPPELAFRGASGAKSLIIESPVTPHASVRAEKLTFSDPLLMLSAEDAATARDIDAALAEDPAVLELIDLAARVSAMSSRAVTVDSLLDTFRRISSAH